MTSSNIPEEFQPEEETIRVPDTLLHDVTSIDADAIIASRPVPTSLLAAVLAQ